MTASAASQEKAPSSEDLLVRELVENGVVHTLNEQVLWPLGLSLTVSVSKTGESLDFSRARLFFEDHGEVIVTGFDLTEHSAEHARFSAFEAKRLNTIKP